MIRVAAPYSKGLGSDRLQIIVRHQSRRRVKTRTFTIEGTRNVEAELKRIQGWYRDMEDQAAADRAQGASGGDGEEAEPTDLAVGGSGPGDGGR